MAERKGTSVPPVRQKWRGHKTAVCCAAVILTAAALFGAAFALSADFRGKVTSYIFPAYTENQLCEIDEGHGTGSFSMEDTLFTFLEKFNRENMEENITVKKDNGFEYVVLAKDENSVNVIVESSVPDEKLLVIMERKEYKETTGLWQVRAYQVIGSETADEMIDDEG